MLYMARLQFQPWPPRTLERRLRCLQLTLQESQWLQSSDLVRIKSFAQVYEDVPLPIVTARDRATAVNAGSDWLKMRTLPTIEPYTNRRMEVIITHRPISTPFIEISPRHNVKSHLNNVCFRHEIYHS